MAPPWQRISGRPPSTGGRLRPRTRAASLPPVVSASAAALALAAVLALATVLALAAAGCAGDDAGGPAGASAPGAAAPTAAAPAVARPGSAGSSGGPPLRILSLAPNLTEILFAMGLGGAVVGRSTQCTYPPEALAVPAVGDTTGLDLEAVIRARPTLAFALTRRAEAVRRLEGLGIRVVAVEADRMDQLRRAIETIGRETGRPEAARRLWTRMEADLAEVRRRVAGLPRPRTLFALPMAVGSSRILVAGRGTFVDDLLRAAGAENAYPDRADWPTLGPQQVVALAPEVVIVNAAGPGPPDRLEVIRRGWAALESVPAVRRGRVHILTDAYLSIPGPRVGLAARRLAETIHPELAGAWTASAAPSPGPKETRP